MAEEIISIDVQNPSNPPQSEGEPLPASASNLVQALVADKDALSALTNALASALGPLIHSHARGQGDKDSESENYTEPAVPVGQSGVEAQQSINARPVATENNNKRTCEESQDDCLEIRAVKRPRAMTSTDIEGDHDELEESDLILGPNSRWEASENLKELINASIQPLKRFERRAIKKEFPRPNVDAAYTPILDSYLVPLIAGIKSPDESLRDVQDKICDVFGPLGGQHPVVHLKPLNRNIPYEHFKMEGIHMLKDLLKTGDYLVKIDMKDAYLTVPIWHKHQKYLRFLWKDNMWEFACLPFGLASAPRVFPKLLKPVVAVLRQMGLRIIHLDDILIMSKSYDLALTHASTALNLLQGLGFVVNYEKSCLEPSQIIGFLGFEINSQTLTISSRETKSER